MRVGGGHEGGEELGADGGTLETSPWCSRTTELLARGLRREARGLRLLERSLVGEAGSHGTLHRCVTCWLTLERELGSQPSPEEASLLRLLRGGRRGRCRFGLGQYGWGLLQDKGVEVDCSPETVVAVVEGSQCVDPVGRQLRVS